MNVRLTRLLLALSALSVSATASAEQSLQLNLTRGVTNISNKVYDLHMLVFLYLSRHWGYRLRCNVLVDFAPPEKSRR